MNTRRLTDVIAGRVMLSLSLGVLSLGLLIGLGLYLRARPVLTTVPLATLLFSTAWHPSSGAFGLANFAAGTFVVTAIAMTIAVPLSLLTSVYVSEYAHGRVRDLVKPVVDVLGGISPVIYGVWGVVAIVPLVRDVIMPFCAKHLPFPPFISDNYTGYSALTAGIVLAVMVFPIVIAVVEEVLHTVPFEMREASIALGATRWQTTRRVVLRKALPGIVAAVILGLSRAFGETMAVLMVSGCSLHTFPKGVFDTAYPLPALIANTYGEMMSIPLYDAAVMLAAFVLLCVTVFFNMAGWGLLMHLERQAR